MTQHRGSQKFWSETELPQICKVDVANIRKVQGAAGNLLRSFALKLYGSLCILLEKQNEIIWELTI